MAIDYKNLKHLTNDEIRYLINKYRQIIKNLTNEYKKRISYKNRYTDDDLYEIKEKTENLITIMGFTGNHFYKEEAYHMIDSFSNYYYASDNKHSKFSYELISTCIVNEILKHYNVKYDVDYLIGIFDLDIKQFIDLEIEISKWSSENYWMR